jgi:hypothetical protein
MFDAELARLLLVIVGAMVVIAFVANAGTKQLGRELINGKSRLRSGVSPTAPLRHNFTA